VRIEAFGHTDIGRNREWNEDSYLCQDLLQRGPFPWRSLHLLAVADGIGGQAGGEKASSLAIETLGEVVADRLKPGGSQTDFPKVLRESCEIANARIFSAAAADSALTGMGTTLVAALVAEDRATVANVGDSRAYRIRGRVLTQVTRDHSWAAEQLRANAMTEEEIRRSPFKNMITRSLGYFEKIEADIFELVLLPDDDLLLCSDGLYGFVSEKQILKAFRRQKQPEKICRKLIRLANDHGGRDNITCVTAYFGEDERRPKPSLTDTVKLKRPAEPGTRRGGEGT
jgi:protein phosphatase